MESLPIWAERAEMTTWRELLIWKRNHQYPLLYWIAWVYSFLVFWIQNTLARLPIRYQMGKYE